MTPETIADGISLFFLRVLINWVVIIFVLGLLWFVLVPVLRVLVSTVLGLLWLMVVALRVMVSTDIFRKRVVSTAKHFAALAVLWAVVVAINPQSALLSIIGILLTPVILVRWAVSLKLPIY